MYIFEKSFFRGEKTVDLMLKRKNKYLTTVKHQMPAYLIMK